jgi:predicted nucleic acid-binding protein
MGKEYLIDSNVIIDFFSGSLPETGRQLVSTMSPSISIISQIEIFSKADIPVSELEVLNKFIKAAHIFILDTSVALAAIELRVKYKMKLPDAVIAATAITNNLNLVTRNVSDFSKIEKLKVINPYTI